MLTAELLDFSRRQGRIAPRLADAEHPGLLRAAEALLALLRSAVGHARGEVERALQAFAPEGLESKALSPRRLRGLADVALEACTFEMRAPLDPRALRRTLFDGAARAWLGGGTSPPTAWGPKRAEALAGATLGLGLAPEQAEAALYADIEANHVLVTAAELTGRQLLLRYNLAQVQGLLLRATGLEISMPWPTPQRLRQLLGWLKFHGLLYDLRDAGPGGGAARQLALSVDGPLSVLEGSARYGLALAQFFPALLLHPGPWQLTAQVRLKRGSPAELRLEPHPGLVSTLPDRGQWVPEGVRDFVAAFNARGGAWRAAPAERLLALPGNAYVVPDFEFTHQGTGAAVAMQHLLYPARERVQALLQRLEGFAPAAAEASLRACWLACRRVPSLPESPLLLTYRRTLLPSLVRERLEALGAGEPG